jgi:hypothetical protein
MSMVTENYHMSRIVLTLPCAATGLLIGCDMYFVSNNKLLPSTHVLGVDNNVLVLSGLLSSEGQMNK